MGTNMRQVPAGGQGHGGQGRGRNLQRAGKLFLKFLNFRISAGSLACREYSSLPLQGERPQDYPLSLRGENFQILKIEEYDCSI